MALRMPRDGTSQPEILTRWACIRAKPRAEQYAADNLYRVGFEVYLPMTMVRRRDRSGRYGMVQVPLFASYLFLEHTPGTTWRGIGRCPGVATLLRNGYEPAYVRVGVIELLRATDAARQDDPAPEPSWKPGMACLISEGAFIGHEAVIIDMRKASARVALPVFGQITTVTVPIASLLPRTD
jgi:transcription antitermination factor NusG